MCIYIEIFKQQYSSRVGHTACARVKLKIGLCTPNNGFVHIYVYTIYCVSGLHSSGIQPWACAHRVYTLSLSPLCQVKRALLAVLSTAKTFHGQKQRVCKTPAINLLNRGYTRAHTRFDARKISFFSMLLLSAYILCAIAEKFPAKWLCKHIIYVIYWRNLF